MKTSLKFALLAAGLMSIVAFARAGDEAKTITGEAKCAKTDMQAQDTCQTVVQVKSEDSTVDYYIVDNEATKGLHEKICGHPQQVTATGTVAEKDGKMELTPTKIELAAAPSEEKPATAEQPKAAEQSTEE